MVGMTYKIITLSIYGFDRGPTTLSGIFFFYEPTSDKNAFTCFPLFE